MLFSYIYMILYSILYIISQEISGYNKQCTSWDKWSNCVGECGGAGIASRYCIRTPNENVSYKNLEYEWKTCKLTRCSLQNYAEIIKGDEFREKELNYLETVVDNCQYRAILDSCIQDYCDYYSLKKILKNYTDRFWNALLCVKHNLGCPTKGGWSDWTLWSKCTATCGPGVQYRLRYCNNPMNSKDSLNCTGNSIEFKNCYGHLCEFKTDGIWCKWSEWSKCNVRQGNGITVRKRFCKASSINNGSSCCGSHTEIKKCYALKVYGGWSDWQKWSHCSTNCGKGNRYKLRSCTRPEPEETGIDCIGSPVEIANCYLEPCKGPLLMVYTFDKDTLVQYSSTNIENSILHIFIRFYPLGGTGTLLRRFHDDCDKCDTVELSLANYELILMAFLNGCTTKIYTSSIIYIGWNEVTFIITKNKLAMNVNNKHFSANLKCNSSIIKCNQVMNIGEGFEGYIEKLYVNFIPFALSTIKQRWDMFLPYSALNVVHEQNEEVIYTDLSQTFKIPCPLNSNLWNIELYIKIQSLAHGNLISINNTSADYILVSILNTFFKLNIKVEDFSYEKLVKFEEIDSSWVHLELEKKFNIIHIIVNGEKHSIILPEDVENELCRDYFYIGYNECNIKSSNIEGVIGFLKVDKEVLNANNYVVNSINEYNFIFYNVSNMIYNEIKKVNNDEIKLNCIVNKNNDYEILDCTWIRITDLSIQKITNDMKDYFVTTKKYTSQISILSNFNEQDQFFLYVSPTIQEIFCAYGVISSDQDDNIDFKTFHYLGIIVGLVAVLSFIFSFIEIIRLIFI